MTQQQLKDSNARTGAVAQTAEAMRDLIVRGQLRAGAALVERRLAQRLDVSRSTVRSALHVLEREGYVVPEGAGKYSRATVAPLTLEDMHEVHELIAALNGMAARRVAILNPSQRAELAEELERINRELRRVAVEEPTNFRALYEADHSFHGCCMKLAARRRLQMLYGITAPQAERYGRMYATAVVGKGLVSASEHEKIIDAVRQGDPDAAELATVRNFLNAAERFENVIQSLGQGERW